ncbi:MAG: aldo/keto reductase [Nitrospinaceae bacterium]|nr:aldo/keto reductase [Nitrospinaceae bacterium]
MKMGDKRSLTRAEFFRLAAGVGASLALGADAEAAGPQLWRKIPSSGEKIPALGLGTARTFDVRLSPALLAPRREVVRLFFKEGGTLIDSSPMYGEAERVTGHLLSELGLHSKSFLATKVWTKGREAGAAQMRESMRLLGAKKLDLMQVHTLSDTATQLRTLREWKSKGLIRYIGITHYGTHAFDEMSEWIKRGSIDFVQFPFSIAVRDAEKRFMPFCADNGVATLVNRPYEKGGLFRAVRGRKLPKWASEFGAASWGQFFLKYILSNPATTSVIPATRKPKHLLDNMGAGRGALPDARMRQKMVRLWKNV